MKNNIKLKFKANKRKFHRSKNYKNLLIEKGINESEMLLKFPGLHNVITASKKSALSYERGDYGQSLYITLTYDDGATIILEELSE